MRIELADELLTVFAERTGLRSGRAPRRYLWTDAFAVCTDLGLARASGPAAGSRSRERALALVGQVHRVLGRFREDDPRQGWISGLGEAEGAAHPTLGGLRIGKPLPERRLDERYTPDLEWERDGQYFHYLTKWMHALDQVARALRSTELNGPELGAPEPARWARELAVAAHGGFVVRAGGATRMIWKASTDLSRPLVPSMGQHDPLDGYVTCLQLAATAAEGPDLGPLIADFRALVEPARLVTTDPLGLGGLLCDAYRLAQLGADPGLLPGILEAAERGLAGLGTTLDPAAPADRRLAFRELGLVLGLVAAQRLAARPDLPSGVRARAERLARLAPLAGALEAFWLEPASRATPLWREHADIDDVMLAACLAPDGFLELVPARDVRAAR